VSRISREKSKRKPILLKIAPDLTDSQLEEALAVGLIVGGSITIPHLRRALQLWEELKTSAES